MLFLSLNHKTQIGGNNQCIPIVVKKGTIFRFNGDFSREIEINKIYIRNNNNCNPITIFVPAIDILEFVAYEYVQTKKISKLEQMSWQELLGGNKEEKIED